MEYGLVTKHALNIVLPTAPLSDYSAEAKDLSKPLQEGLDCARSRNLVRSCGRQWRQNARTVAQHRDSIISWARQPIITDDPQPHRPSEFSSYIYPELLNNFEFPSHKEFVSCLSQSWISVRNELQGAPYQLLVNASPGEVKSESWVLGLLLRYEPSFRPNDPSMEINKQLKNFLIVDDASYSGDQLKGYVKERLHQLTQAGIRDATLHVVVPFISRNTLINLESVVNSTFRVMLHFGKKMMTIDQLAITNPGIVPDLRCATIFSHKVADEFSIPGIADAARGTPIYKQHPIDFRSFRRIGREAIEFGQKGFSYKDFVALSQLTPQQKIAAYSLRHQGIDPKIAIDFAFGSQNRVDIVILSLKMGVNIDTVMAMINGELDYKKIEALEPNQLRDFIQLFHKGFSFTDAHTVAALNAESRKLILDSSRLGFDSSQSMMLIEFSSTQIQRVLRASAKGMGNSEAIAMAHLSEDQFNDVMRCILFDISISVALRIGRIESQIDRGLIIESFRGKARTEAEKMLSRLEL